MRIAASADFTGGGLGPLVVALLVTEREFEAQEYDLTVEGATASELLVKTTMVIPAARVQGMVARLEVLLGPCFEAVPMMEHILIRYRGRG